MGKIDAQPGDGAPEVFRVKKPERQIALKVVKTTQNNFMDAIKKSNASGKVPFVVDLGGAMRVNFTYHGYDTVCDVGAMVAANTGERVPGKDIGEQMRRKYIEGVQKIGYTVYL